MRNIYLLQNQNYLKLKTIEVKKDIILFFKNFLKIRKRQHYSRFIDKDPSNAEKVFKTMRYLPKNQFVYKGTLIGYLIYHLLLKPITILFEAQLKSLPLQFFKKLIKKYSSLTSRTRWRTQKPKNKLGDLVSTSDCRSVFREGDSSKKSFELYSITEVKNVTILSYRIKFLPGRYSKSLLKTTKLFLGENNQVK